MEHRQDSDRLIKYTNSGDYFDPQIISSVLEKAKTSEKGRYNLRIHEKDEDKQHLFINAIVANNYVQPHVHGEEGKTEIFRILKGEANVVIFNDLGEITKIVRLSDKEDGRKIIVIKTGQIHTVVCEVDVVLLESKKQPSGYRSQDDKYFVPWAPKEGTEEAKRYYQELLLKIKESN
jgi:cupin fold WbuC family metalloprotein